MISSQLAKKECSAFVTSVPLFFDFLMPFHHNNMELSYLSHHLWLNEEKQKKQNMSIHSSLLLKLALP